MELLTRKFTVDQYHQMAEQGILHCQERLELIAGEIINMSPIGFRHASTPNRLINRFLPDMPQVGGELKPTFRRLAGN